MLAHAGPKCNIYINSILNGKVVRQIIGHTKNVMYVQILHNGKYLLSGDKSMKFWDIICGINEITIIAHDDAIRTIAITKNDNYAITGSFDKSIKIWNI